MLTKDSIDNSFSYHQPVGTQPARYSLLRITGLGLAQAIMDQCPESAEKTLAIRKVEEAVMWANKAIACNE